MLHFQEETFARVRDDVQALAQAHWDEVEAALHGDQAYRLDKERYAALERLGICLLYTSPSPRDRSVSRMPSSA